MRLGRSKRLAAGLGAAALLSGGAGAVAASQLSSNPHRAYINDVARRLHVTPAALTTAMKAARIDQINAAEKAGKLTAAQAKTAKSRIRSGRQLGGYGGPAGLGMGPGPGFGRGRMGSLHGAYACGGPMTPTSTAGKGATPTTTTPTPKPAWRCAPGPAFGPRGFRRFFRCGGPVTPATTTSTTSTPTTPSAKPCLASGGFWSRAGFGHGPRLGFRGGLGLGIGLGPRLLRFGESAVKRYLGIGAGTLRSDLASGKTLAQIASATSGKSVSGLESAVTAAAKTRLDKAVSKGRITSAQEARIVSALSSRLSKLVNLSIKIPAGARPLRAWSH